MWVRGQKSEAPVESLLTAARDGRNLTRMDNTQHIVNSNSPPNSSAHHETDGSGRERQFSPVGCLVELLTSHLGCDLERVGQARDMEELLGALPDSPNVLRLVRAAEDLTRFDEPLLREQEIMRALSVGRDFVRRHRRELGAVNLGSRGHGAEWRYKPDAVKAYIERRSEGASSRRRKR